MKTKVKDLNYRLVVFQDLNSREFFLVKSTAETKETIEWKDGQAYPLVKLHVTSASHPFYTGQEKMIDIEGRVDKFKNRQKAAQEAQELLKAKTVKTIKKASQKKPARQSNPLQDLKQSKPAKAKRSTVAKKSDSDD